MPMAIDINQETEVDTLLIDEVLAALRQRLLDGSVEANPNDNKTNCSPELSVLSREIFNAVLAITRDAKSVARNQPLFAELHEKVMTVYDDIVTKDGAPTGVYSPRTALILGELRFAIRLLHIALETLPPPSAHPEPIGTRQFYSRPASA